MTGATAAEVRKALAAVRRLRRPAASLLAAAARAERLASDRTDLEVHLFAEPTEPLRHLLEAPSPKDSMTPARACGARRQLREPIPPSAHATPARDALHREPARAHPRLVHDAARADSRPGGADVGPRSRIRRGPVSLNPEPAGSLGALRDRIRRNPETKAGAAPGVMQTGAAPRPGESSPPAGFKERMIATAGDRTLSLSSQRPTGRATPAGTSGVERIARRREGAGPSGAVAVSDLSPHPDWTGSPESPAGGPPTRPSGHPRPEGLAVPSWTVPAAKSRGGTAMSTAVENVTGLARRDPPPSIAPATAAPPDMPRQSREEPWIPAPIAPRTAEAAIEREDEDALFEEAYRHGIDLT